VSGDKTAKVWDLSSQTAIREYNFGSQVDDQQVGCLWQGNHLITVALSGNISYLNFNESGSFLRTLKGHSKSITALEINQGLMFSGSHDGLIIYWDISTGHMDSIKPGNVKAHTNQVQTLRYSQLSNELVSAGLDDTVKFINLERFEYTHEVRLGSQPRGLDVAESNGMIVVGCINELVVLTNRQISQAVKIGYEATCVSIGRDYVAVGGQDNKCHVYEASTMQELAVLDSRDFITSVRFSHDGKFLAVADNTKNVKCYRVNGDVLKEPKFTDVTRDMWQHCAGKITNLSWSPDDKHLAASSVDTQCFIYSPDNISSYIQIKSEIFFVFV